MYSYYKFVLVYISSNVTTGNFSLANMLNSVQDPWSSLTEIKLPEFLYLANILNFKVIPFIQGILMILIVKICDCVCVCSIVELPDIF